MEFYGKDRLTILTTFLVVYCPFCQLDYYPMSRYVMRLVAADAGLQILIARVETQECAAMPVAGLAPRCKQIHATIVKVALAPSTGLPNSPITVSFATQFARL